MDLIIAYLRNSELPEGKIEAHILRLKATRYVLYDDKLYRRGCSMPLLKCIPPSEAEYVMRDIHEGICGNHAGGAVPSIQNPKTGLLLTNHKGELDVSLENVTSANGFHLCRKPIQRNYFP